MALPLPREARKDSWRPTLLQPRKPTKVSQRLGAVVSKLNSALAALRQQNGQPMRLCTNCWRRARGQNSTTSSQLSLRWLQLPTGRPMSLENEKCGPLLEQVSLQVVPLFAWRRGVSRRSMLGRRGPELVVSLLLRLSLPTQPRPYREMRLSPLSRLPVALALAGKRLRPLRVRLLALL